MSKRPLHTLPLPPATLAALTRAGYETSDDLAASTPEELARGSCSRLVTGRIATHWTCPHRCAYFVIFFASSVFRDSGSDGPSAHTDRLFSC